MVGGQAATVTVSPQRERVALEGVQVAREELDQWIADLAATEARLRRLAGILDDPEGDPSHPQRTAVVNRYAERLHHRANVLRRIVACTADVELAAKKLSREGYRALEAAWRAEAALPVGAPRPEGLAAVCWALAWRASPEPFNYDRRDGRRKVMGA